MTIGCSCHLNSFFRFAQVVADRELTFAAQPTYSKAGSNGTPQRPELLTPARAAARVGTFIVTVGVGGGIASTAGTPTAQADSVVDKLTPNVGVSMGGLGYNSGTARAITAGPNLAIAIGKNASAEADNGIGNSAVVVGNRSTGTSTNGNFNRVRINGDDNTGYAGDGDNNVVRVKGNGNAVQAGGGDNNRATVTGDVNEVRVGCLAVASPDAVGNCGGVRHSNDNSAAVEGHRNTVWAGGLKSETDLIDADFDGSDNSITVSGDDNSAGLYGNRSTSSITGNRNNRIDIWFWEEPFAGYDDTNVTIAEDDTTVFVSEDGFTYP